MAKPPQADEQWRTGAVALLALMSPYLASLINTSKVEAILSPRFSESSLSFLSANSDRAKDVRCFAIFICGNYVVTLRCKPYHKFMSFKAQALAERFWSKVDKSGDCWIWTASVCSKGYGRILIDRKATRAHRVAYELTNGTIPDGLVVRHRCDNPACVNPSHLILGTSTDNMQDMVERGRGFHQQKTHCPQGHEYTSENTRLRVRAGTQRYKRSCLECERSQGLARYHANKNGTQQSD